MQYRSLSSSQESVTKSLLSHRSSRASSSAVEFVDENEKKREDLNLYDWLSSTNSPRQASDVAKSPVPNRAEIGEAPGNDSTGRNSNDFVGIVRKSREKFVNDSSRTFRLKLIEIVCQKENGNEGLFY